MVEKGKERRPIRIRWGKQPPDILDHRKEERRKKKKNKPSVTSTSRILGKGKEDLA